MQATMQRTGQRFADAVARRSISLPSTSPRRAMRSICWSSSARPSRFSTTGEIHGQGDQADFCYRILSGCVRTVKLMEDGRRQIGEFLMAGDLLGFDALETYDFAAEAVSDVVLRRYPAADGGSAGREQRRPDAAAARHDGISLRMAHSRLVLLGRKTASERIASFLLEMVERLPAARRPCAGPADGPHRHSRSSRPDHRDGVPRAGASAPRRHGRDRARQHHDPRRCRVAANGVRAAALIRPSHAERDRRPVPTVDRFLLRKL